MAIAFVSSADLGNNNAIGHTLSANFTAVGGIGHRLWVCFSSDQTLDDIVGVTYAGTAMSFAVKVAPQGLGWNTRGVYLYYLDNIAAGSNAAVITSSNDHQLAMVAAEYSGVLAGTPDNTTTNGGAGAPSILTTNLTTVKDNCWTVLGENNENSSGTTVTATGGLILRVKGASFGQPILFDSNAAIHPAASYSMQTTSSANVGQVHAVASFAPTLPFQSYDPWQLRAPLLAQ